MGCPEACGYWSSGLTLVLVNAGQILLVLFAGCAAVQGAVYILVFARVLFYKDRGLEAASAAPERVTVLVCARNEAPNLRNNLPSLLAQQYPDWELLVVDDGSTDGSAAWLDEQALLHPRMRVLHVAAAEKPGPGKKGALALGIAQASGSILLLTDADCRPSSPYWMQHMASAFNGSDPSSDSVSNPGSDSVSDPGSDRSANPPGNASKTRAPTVDFVLGYGAYSPGPGWLNCVVQFETLHTLLQYASWTLAGMPYMGVGRNLAYRKSVFLEGGGFSAHQHWPSGDDDLFVNANAKKGRVALCLHPQAWTESAPPATWSAWVTQKSRHLSTGVFYRPLHRIVLGIYAMSHFGLYATLLASSAVCGWIPWILLVFLLRLLVLHGMIWHLGKRFNRPLLWHFSTIFDFWTVAYYARFVGSTLSPKPPLWR